MVKPDSKEEVVTIPKYSDLNEKFMETNNANLKKCMEAPKLQPTLENGFIHDNKDHLHEIVSKMGRRRNFQYYFNSPYKH